MKRGESKKVPMILVCVWCKEKKALAFEMKQPVLSVDKLDRRNK